MFDNIINPFKRKTKYAGTTLVETYVKYTTKSRAGIKYTHYKRRLRRV